MKIIIIAISILLYSPIFGQKSIVNEIMLGEELYEINSIKEFNNSDFSHLWSKTPNRNVFGIIGEKHKRLKIKLITISKNSNSQIYRVYGKSCVDGNICEFEGTITTKKIMKLKEFHYGVDDEFKQSGIMNQGVLIADYKFEENNEQNDSGIFSGTLYSKWYSNDSNEIKYDDIQVQSDSYINNAFVGEWKSYNSNNSRICNWGDFRVPNCNIDFDIGAGEFSPSEKYNSQGWENYQKAWLYNDSEARKIELDEWWK